MKQEDVKDKQPREVRSMAQQIRRNMITRIKPSAKIYSRKRVKSLEVFS